MLAQKETRFESSSNRDSRKGRRRNMLEKVDQEGVGGMRARRGLADRPMIRVDEMKGVLIRKDEGKRRIG